jgi:hypothetical protein
MRIRILLFLLLVFGISATAQTTIKGKVVDAVTLLPVEDAIISLSEEKMNTVILDFTVSDSKGEYSLLSKGKAERITISVSGFNLKKQSRTIENKSQTLNFSVEQEEIKLNEVIVKAPKIRQSGDTLNYNVAQFTGNEDRSIADVLKKMPGIQVRTDGTVLYQNRPINKFYIENLDLLQGRYGIATNNISAKDVATVQVMEYHQPVRALIGKEFVNEAALNLRLRESAKGAFFLKAQAGIGAKPLLLSNELLGMYFTRNMQHLSIYKGDNSGRDVAQELQSLYITSKENINIREMIHTVTSSSPSIPQQRYLFNNAHTATVNNLNKLGKRYTLTTNLNYVYDKIEKDGHSFSEYFLPRNEIVQINEKMNSVSRKNIFDAAFNLNANTDTYYFNNDLKLSGTWNNDASDIVSNQNPVNQQLKTPYYSVTNFFDLVKTSGKKIYKAQSFVGYKDIRQDFTVTPPTLKGIVPSEIHPQSINQTLNLSVFETRNRLSWSKTGRLSLDYTAGINASVHKLHSELSANENRQRHTADTLQNSLVRNYIEGVFSGTTSYDITPTMNFRATLPLRYLSLWNDNNEKTAETFFYIDPFVMLNWQLSARWSSNLMYGVTHLVGGIEKDYTNPVLLNYRLLMRNDEKLEKILNHNAMLLLGYKNPFTTFFGSLSVFYNKNRQNLLNEYHYNGIFTRRKSVEKLNSINHFTISVSVGKDVEALRSNVSLNISYSGNWTEQIIQSRIVNSYNQSVSASPRVTTRIVSIATVQYGATYSRFQSRLDLSDSALPRIEIFSQNFNVNLFPATNIVVFFRCDYFQNSSINTQNKKIWFGDIGIKYKLKTVELLLDWNNIFNTTHYAVSSYADTGRYFYSYKLRPSEMLLRVRFNIL